MDEPQHFTISFGWPTRLLLTPLFAGPRRCGVDVDDDDVRVRMGAGGWAWAATVPRRSITDVGRAHGIPMGWGAHGWRGRWLVNGSSRNRVTMTIEPPARGRCLFVPVRVRQLTVSLDHPESFIAALGF